MAKLLSHFYEFKSNGINGNDGHKYRVEFYIEGFSGTVTELIAGAEPFVQSYNKDMYNAYVGSMIPSVANFQAISDTDFYARYFSSENYGDVIVRVLKDYGSPEQKLVFSGIVVPFESSDLDRDTGLYTVTISAECGLSSLKNTPYFTSQTDATAKSRLLEIVQKCISRIPVIDPDDFIYDFNHQGFYLFDQTVMFTESGKVMPKARDWGYWELFISESNFENMSCWDVIDSLKQPYSDFFYEEGYWHIRNISDYGNYTPAGIANSTLRIVNFDLISTTVYDDYPRTPSLVQRLAGGNFGSMFTDKRISIEKKASALKNSDSDFGEFNNLDGWEFYTTPVNATYTPPGTNQQYIIASSPGPYGVLSDFWELYNGYLRNNQVNQLFTSEEWHTVNAPVYDMYKRLVPRLVSPPFFFNPYKKMNPNDDGVFELGDGVRVTIRAIFGDNISHLVCTVVVIGPMQDEEPFTSILKENGEWISVKKGTVGYKQYNLPIHIPKPQNDDDLIFIDIPSPPPPTQSKKKKFLWWKKETSLTWDRVEDGLYFDDPTTDVDNQLSFSPVYQLRVMIHPPVKPNAKLNVSDGLDVDSEDDRLYIDYIRVAETTNDGAVSEGFTITYVPADNQVVERTDNNVIDLRVGYPSDKGADALFESSSGDESMVLTYGNAGDVSESDSKTIDKHLAVNYLGVSSNNRLGTYQGDVIADINFSSLIGIDGKPYRIQNFSKDFRTNISSVKIIENSFSDIEVTEPRYISIYDKDRLPLEIRYSQVQSVKIIGPNISYQGYGGALGSSNSLSGQGGGGQGFYLMSSDVVYNSVTTNMFAQVSESGNALFVDETEDGDEGEVFTLIKPAEDGTYATREWSKKNLWVLGGNETTASQLDLGTKTNANIRLIVNNATAGQITGTSWVIGDYTAVSGTLEALTVKGAIRQTFLVGDKIVKVDAVGKFVEAVDGTDYFKPATANARFLRKDANDNNGAFKLTLGQLDAGATKITGTLDLTGVNAGTNETRVLTMNSAGSVKYREVSDLGAINILNSAGGLEFDVVLGEGIRIEGSGDTTVAFDSATKKITITSIPGSGTGGIGLVSFNGRTAAAALPTAGDYSTSMVTESGTHLYFTQARVLSTPLTGYALGTNTAIAASDTLLQMAGKLQAQINAKQATITVSASKLLGRYSVTSGVPQEISIGAGLSLNSTTGVLSATGSGGTVTSVSVSVPSFLSVSGSPITSSGTIAISLANQNANLVFAGPTTGTAAAPTFRALAAADIPNLDAAKITTGVIGTARLGSGTASSSTILYGDGTWKTAPTAPSWSDITDKPNSGNYVWFGGDQTGIGGNKDWTGTHSFLMEAGTIRMSTFGPQLDLTITGSWARGYLITTDGVTGTLPGFGARGTSSSASYLYMGFNFDASNAIRVYPSGDPTVGTNIIFHAGNFPTLRPSLQAIENLPGTSGLVRKTAANTFVLDTATYLTSASLSGYLPLTGGILTGNLTINTNLFIGSGVISQGAGAILGMSGSALIMSNPEASPTGIYIRPNGRSSSAAQLLVSSSAFSFDGNTVFHAGNFPTLRPSLQAIENLSGTSGLVRKTAANTFVLDTATYLTTNQNITISGDATGSGTTSIAVTIANSAVTYAKIQNVAASRLLGRYATTAGVAQEITIGTGLSLNSTTGVLSATGSGGTVTSVSVSVPSFLSVSGSPITSSGTIAISLANQNANLVFAGPTTGTAAAPTFRALAAADIPNLDAAKITTGVIGTARLGSGTASSSTILYGDGTWKTAPTGASLTNKQIGVGNVSNTLSGSSGFTFEDNRYINIVSATKTAAFGVTTSNAFFQSVDGDVLLQPKSGNRVIVENGPLRVNNLSGVESRYVRVTASGDLEAGLVAPKSPITNKQIGFGDASNLLTGNANFTLEEVRYIRLVNGSGTMNVGVVSNNVFLEAPSGNILLQANSSAYVVVDSGGFRVDALAGSGTRYVQVDSSGNFSTTTSGGSTTLTNKQIGFGNSSNQVSGVAGFTFEETRYIYIEAFSNGGTGGLAAGTWGTTGFVEAPKGHLVLQSQSGSQIVLQSQTRIDSLAGSGNRMVVANSSGVLSTQAIPSGGGASLAASQVGYGTGSGITSSSKFYYSDISSSLTLSEGAFLTSLSAQPSGIYRSGYQEGPLQVERNDTSSRRSAIRIQQNTSGSGGTSTYFDFDDTTLNSHSSISIGDRVILECYRKDSGVLAFRLVKV